MPGGDIDVIVGAGGAAGTGSQAAGGAGAGGRVSITWTCPAYTLAATSSTISNPAAGATVSVSGLPDGTYTVTYDLSGAHTASGQTTTLAVSGGTGSFSTIALTNNGTTTVTITNLSSGTSPFVCDNTVAANNTTSFSFSISNPSNPYLSSDNFTVPDGITSITVECWGGGGGENTAGAKGGGGGGAYASSVLSVMPGNTHVITVGAGGAPGFAGGPSSFDALVIAAGGSSTTDGNGGAGGSAGSSTGDDVASGGAGGNAGTGNIENGGGGGGGSASGSMAGGNGGDGTTTGGAGGDGAGDGGNGGDGDGNPSGSNGSTPGGGGGGKGTTGNSGSGANGQVIVTYSCSAYLSLTSGAGTDNQTINNSLLTDITYAVGGNATSATVTGLPTGVSGSFSAGVFTITGIPTVTGTFPFTVETATAAGCDNATLSGTITVTVPLPIELLSFTGKAVEKAIELSWATASEQDNDYMAVERSADGVKFEEIGRVQGAGTTQEPQQYSFTDESPRRGINYYRLRQVDFDGAVEYHKVISVAFDAKGSGLGLSAFPNPASEMLYTSWLPSAEQPATLRVLDMTGRQLAAYEALAGSTSFELPLNNLPAGLYLLEVQQGGAVEVVRFRRD